VKQVTGKPYRQFLAGRRGLKSKEQMSWGGGNGSELLWGKHVRTGGRGSLSDQKSGLGVTFEEKKKFVVGG